MKLNRNRMLAEKNESSDEDSTGKIKPSHKPFNKVDVTFDFNGKIVQIKRPTLSKKDELSQINQLVKL